MGASPLAIKERLGHADVLTTFHKYGHLFQGVQERLTAQLEEAHASSETGSGSRTRRNWPRRRPEWHAAAERVLFAERLVLGTFDFDHLRALHRHLFGEVYDWAGELRTVSMTKGGTLFALAEWVEPQARQLLDRLRADGQLRDLDRGDFVTAAGRLLSDLNALAPVPRGKRPCPESLSAAPRQCRRLAT